MTEEASGALRATPIMHWLEERGGPIERFHQAMLLRAPAGMREEDLVAALQALVDHHDALRLRLEVGCRGRVEVLDCAAGARYWARDCLRRVEVGGLDAERLRACIGAAGEAAQERLSPARGRMLQAVWFDAGERTPGRLLLSIHHLSVDGVSWRILVPDLAACWEAIVAAGGAPSFRRGEHRFVAGASGCGRRRRPSVAWRSLRNGAGC